MKARIKNQVFKGIYTDEFLEKNLSNIVNDELVSNWELTEILPTDNELNFIKLKFDGNAYFEGASIDEINEAENSKIQARKMEVYNELLLTDWYLIRQLETGIPVPTEILTERQNIRNRYA